MNGSTVLLAAGGGGGGGANAAGSYGGTGGGGGQNGATTSWAVGGASGGNSTYNGLSCGARSGCDGAGSGGGGGGYLGGAAGNDDVACEDGSGSGGGGGTNYGTITSIGNGATPGYGNYPLPAGVATGGNYDQTYGTNPGGGGYVIIEYNSPIQITPTVSGVSCLGNDGSASITVSGGGAPFTYSWSTSPVQTGTSVSGLSIGSYTVTVQDANGCSNFSIINITNNTPIPSPIVTNSYGCLSNGSVNANVTGGKTPYTYAWTPSGSGPIVSGLSTGSFTLTVTDAQGCTGSATATVTYIPMSITIASNANTIACAPTGTATANAATSGTSPYTYAWSPSGGTDLMASNLSAGTYTITATDPNGCNASASTTINETSAIQFQTSGTQTYAFSPLIRTWTVPAGVSSITVTASGGGGGRGRGGLGGRGAIITNAVVSVTSGHTIDIITGGVGGTGTFGGGGGGGTYVWDAASSTTPLVVAGGGGGGGYYNTNSTGSAASTTTSAHNYTSTYDNTTQVNITGGGGGSHVSFVGGGGGAGWNGNGANGTGTAASHGGTAATNGGTGGTAGSNGAAGGFGGGGGSGYGGGGGGGYNGGGGGNDNYSIFAAGGGGGGSAVNGANPLICSATNSTNGSVTIRYTLSQNPIVINNVSCNGGSDGSLSAPSVTGGTTPYTYSWAPSGGTNTTASNLSAASYTITITDASGCSLTSASTITQPVALVASGIATANVSCNGGSNGTATASPSNGTSPYTYLWSDASSQTTAIATGLSAGSYTLTVQDNCGASQTTSVSFSQPNVLSAVASVNSAVTCYGINNGSAIANPSNGTAPYTYLWSDASSQTSATATGLTAGSYTITVTDKCGSSQTASVIITQPYALSGTAIVNAHVSCNGNSNGSASANPSNGTLPYTYLWSDANSQATANATGLSAGSYTVSIQDNCGASSTASVTITQPTSLSCTASVNANEICNGGYTGSVIANPAGGANQYTYLWNDANSQTTASANGLSAGSYIVIVQDANGCSTTATVAITQPSAVAANWWSHYAVSCYGGSNGKVISNVTGGTAPYTYAWSNGQTTGTASNLTAGVYSLTVNDRNGCTASNSITLTQPSAALSETITMNSNLSCFGNKTGSATANPTGGTSPYTYAWTPNGGSQQTSITLPAGNDNCKVTDNHGCTTTASVSLTQPTVISATFTKTIPLCYGSSNGSITATGKGGSGTYVSYSWAPYGGGNFNATGLSAQTYTVTIADNNGCTGTSPVVLAQPAQLAASIPTFTCVVGGKGTVTANVTGGTAAYHYVWSNGTSTVGIAKTVTLPNGSYTVTVTDSHNCANTTANIIITGCPDILPRGGNNGGGNDISGGSLMDFTVYPNPTNGQFNIDGLESGMIVEIYDFTGRKLNSPVAINNSQSTINLSNEPNGIYLIRILDKDGNLVGQKKIVKTN